jgi:hypothetical protein
MFINNNNYIKFTIIFYIIISIIIWVKKPKLLFYNNKLRIFGIGPNKTIFYYPFIIIILAIILYFIFFNISMIKSLKYTN